MLHRLLVFAMGGSSPAIPVATLPDAIFFDDFGAEPGALRGITAEHNAVRARVGAPPLVWDERVAANAQAWAEMCVDRNRDGMLDHNANRGAGLSWYVGENIYASSGKVTPKAAVRDWVAESRNYNYATASCAKGKVCGHYTQVVWSATLRLGCGIAHCAKLKLANTIVCDYAPGGNYPGEKPYPEAPIHR